MIRSVRADRLLRITNNRHCNSASSCVTVSRRSDCNRCYPKLSRRIAVASGTGAVGSTSSPYPPSWVTKASIRDHRRHCATSSFVDTNRNKQDEKQHEKVKLCYLDLRGLGISILERMVIEECILKHDPERRHWMICGTHTAAPHKYLQILPDTDTSRFRHSSTTDADDGNDNRFHVLESTPSRNDAVAIVMGIGGKPKELLNIENVQKDHVLVMKRFTGGGTVVIDYNSIWTTIIGRPSTITHANNLHSKDTSVVHHPLQPSHHPRPIMEYTANTIYDPIFERLASLQKQEETTKPNERRKTLILDSKSCSLDNSGRVLSVPLNRSKKDWSKVDSSSSLSALASYTFALQENDYVLRHNLTDDVYKMGGNAQAITKDGFLHHTSFLWDYDTYNMEEYLLLPKKRPQYRLDRDHTDFLISLQTIYPMLQKQHFFRAMHDTCHDTFDVQHMSFIDVMRSIINVQGGIQRWYETQSRTKIIHDLS